MSILEKFSLEGKKGFVTGGARGIGFSYATALTQAGADIAIVDNRGDAAEEAAQKLREATGRKVIAIETDVTDPKQVDQMAERVVNEFGSIDIAFCNAGIAIHQPAEEMEYDVWRKVIDVNLTGVFLTDQAAGRQMLKQGKGAIINTCSMSAHVVNIPQKQVSYNASKGGVLQLTKTLAVEWATRGVRVNCISPGYMATAITVGIPELKPMVAEWESLTPMKRLGNLEDLQAIAVYLASDAGMFTTGSEFIIDGAYSCI